MNVLGGKVVAVSWLVSWQLFRVRFTIVNQPFCFIIVPIISVENVVSMNSFIYILILGQ